MNYHAVSESSVQAHVRHTAHGDVFIPEHHRSSHARLTTEQRQAKAEADMDKIRLRRQQRAAGLI